MGKRKRVRAPNEGPSSRERSNLPGSSYSIDVAPGIPATPTLGWKDRREILAAYERVLELHSNSMKPASSLPYPKERIREAIIEEMAETDEAEDRTRLELLYSQLEAFLNTREYGLLAEFTRIRSVVDQLARSGNPLDLLDAGDMVKRFPGEQVIEIFQRVSRQMRIRLAEVRRLSTLSTL